MNEGDSWHDLVADTGSTDTSYAHTGLAAGFIRYYRVSAINANGSGASSNVVRGATTSTTVTLTVSTVSVAEDGGAKTVTVTGALDGATRSAATGITVSVGASTDSAAEGADYAVVDDFTLTIDADETTGMATFTLTPIDDSLYEGDEYISITGTTTTSGLTVADNELGITDDDPMTTTVDLSVMPATVSEDATATSVTVTAELSGGARASDASVTVSVGATADGAAEGTDYATVNDFTLTISAGQTSGTATFTLSPSDDSVHEGNEKVSVTGTTSATDLTVSGTELTITDNETLSTAVTLSVNPTSVAENANATSVTVTGALNGGARESDASVTVSVGDSADSATEGADYTAVNDFTLTISAGQTSGTATFTVTPSDDSVYEGSERISVTGATTASGLTVSGTELVITDNETQSTEVALTVDPTSVAENANATSVTVTGALNGGARTGPTTVTVSVGASADTATEGADYTTVNDLTLTIGAGQTSGTATFTLTPADDTLGEGAEKVSVTGTTTASGLAVKRTELTLTDDETLSTEVALTVDPTSVAENANATSVTVTGALNGGARTEAATVTVSVGASTDSATEGTDYTTVNDLTLTISAGQTSGTATFTLTPADDTLAEGGETVSVTGTTTASGLSVSGTELTLADDDSASTQVALSVDPRSVAENAAATTVTVTGTLDGATRTQPTTLTVSVGAGTDTATEGTDYGAVNDFTLTIGAGQPVGTATFTLTPANDILGEGAELVSVTGTTTVSGLSVSGTDLTLTDDDSASTEVALSVDPTSVAENADATAVTVTGTLDDAARTGATTVTVSVGASADSATEGADYTTVNDLTLTIGAGQTTGTATFTLTPANDAVAEGAERISVSGTTTASGLSVSDTELTVTDDDSASTQVALSASPRSVAENAAATTVTITGTLNRAARTGAATVTVSVGASTDSATEGTDYTTVNALTLTINAGQTRGTATFTLTPANDTVAEGAERISVSGTTTASGLSVSGTGLTITDDDAASTVVALSVNPTSVAENAAATTVTITGTLNGAARTGATAVTVSVGASTDSATEGSDYTTVNDLTLTISAGQTTGTATFTLTPTNDTVAEGAERISVSGATTAGGLSVTGTTLTLADDERRSDVKLDAVGKMVAEKVAEAVTLSIIGTLKGEARNSATRITVSVGAAADAATKGADYAVVEDFVLTIPAGHTRGTASFRFTPLNDGIPEPDESVSVSGSVAGGDLRVSGTTVTIADDDRHRVEVASALSRAWLARFGRTVADQVLEAVERRVGQGRSAGTELSLAGQRVGGAPEQPERTAALGEPGPWRWGEKRDGDGRFEWRPVTGREFLRGSSFGLTGGSAEGGFGALWGRGAVTGLDGREGALTLDGEVVSGMLGADWNGRRGSAGVALAHSRGKGEYAGSNGPGTVESALTGVYPYGHYELSGRLSLWGVAGYGTGTFTMTPEGTAAMEADSALAMVAVGGRGVVMEPSEGSGLELTVKPDVLVARTSSDASEGLAASEADVRRFRLGLEGIWRGIAAGGGTLAPGFEIGLRHDGGDAESGFGADIGAGLTWRDPALGIAAELRARGLLTHDDGGFRERGFSGSLAWDPHPASERGPKLTLVQTIGAAATGGMDTLLRPDAAAAFAGTDSHADDPGRRLEAKFGYGLAVWGGRYTATPEIGIGLSDGTRESSLGWRLAGPRRGNLGLDIGIEVSRLQPTGEHRTPEHRVGFNITARW